MTHVLSDGRLDGNGDDSCKDAAVESGGKLNCLIGSEHKRHTVPRLHHSAPAQLVEHVVRHLLRPVGQFPWQLICTHEYIIHCIHVHG